MKPRIPLVVLLMLGAVVLHDSAVAAPFFWTDPDPVADSIRYANSDGSGMQTILTGAQQPRGMALDLPDGKLYWAAPGASAVFRADLDGTGRETFAVTHDGSGSVAIDEVHGKVYWSDSATNQIHANVRGGQILRANIDGSNVQSIAGDMIQPGGLDVDAIHGKVYWTELEQKNDGLGSIQRSNLDGTGRETLLTGIDEANGMAVDAIHGRIYWTDLTTHRIQSANLDGTGVADVLTGLDAPTQIDLNLSEGKLYWTSSGGQNTNAIFRADLDGSDVETLVSGVGFPFGIAVVPEPSSLILGALGLIGFTAWGWRRKR